MAIKRTAEFDQWLRGLKDVNAQARIYKRMDRLAAGNAGDVKPIGHGLSELRIDYGPGYRVYFTRRGEVLIIVLAGGDKRTQDRDIADAIRLAANLPEEFKS